MAEGCSDMEGSTEGDITAACDKRQKSLFYQLSHDSTDNHIQYTDIIHSRNSQIYGEDVIQVSRVIAYEVCDRIERHVLKMCFKKAA